MMKKNKYQICISVQNGWFDKIFLRNHSASCDVWKKQDKKNRNENYDIFSSFKKNQIIKK